MTLTNCLNCNRRLDASDKYCAHCGQSTTETKITIFQIVKDFLSKILNLDSGLAHTLKDIYKPSLLANRYIAGQRKYYINPAKLFVFSLLTLFSLMLWQASLDFDGLSDGFNREVNNILVSRDFNAKIDSSDSLESRQCMELVRKSFIDSLDIGESEFINLELGNTASFKILKVDIVELSIEELEEKYAITSFWDKFLFKQVYKGIKDPGNGIKFAIKNLSWVILATVFFMALILKILFYRSNRFYVEHLILILYGHSFVFLLSILLLILYMIGLDVSTNYLVLGLPLFVIQVLSIKKFYKEKLRWTILKSILFNVVYGGALFVLALIGAIISFIIF